MRRTGEGGLTPSKVWVESEVRASQGPVISNSGQISLLGGRHAAYVEGSASGLCRPTPLGSVVVKKNTGGEGGLNPNRPQTLRESALDPPPKLNEHGPQIIFLVPKKKNLVPFFPRLRREKNYIKKNTYFHRPF